MKLTRETTFLLGVGGAIALGVGALAFLNKVSSTPPAPPTPPPPITAVQVDELFHKSHHQEGDASAPLTLIEFGDFQCPNCRLAFKDTIAKLGTRVPAYRLAFFNLPLPIHERAIPAAEAAEAAAKQGKFWPMYAALFDGKSEGLDDKKLQAAALTAGLDMTKFAADSKDEPSLNALVDSDKQIALGLNIGMTPTFLLHDKQGNTAVLVGADNLERLLPDLKDGVIGNDPIAPQDKTTKNPPIQLSIGGKPVQK